MLKKQSDIARRQVGTHLRTDRMDNLGPGVSDMMKISAKTLEIQANEPLLITQCTGKRLFEHDLILINMTNSASLILNLSPHSKRSYKLCLIYSSCTQTQVQRAPNRIVCT